MVLENELTHNDFIESLESLDDSEKKSLKFRSMIASILLYERKERNMSQLELGKLCGVKQPYIARIEKGKADIQISTLIKLLLALNYKITISKISTN